LESLTAWIESSFAGDDISERVKQKDNAHDLWFEMCETLETEQGADMMERVREEKLDIVADLSAREIAEKRTRVKRSMGESGSYLEVVSSMERNSFSAADAMTLQHELRAKIDTDKLAKLDEWKQKEVRFIASNLLLLLFGEDDYE
jgi:hypothetical protein